MGAPITVGSPLVDTPLISITERAASKARDLLAERDITQGMLRVFVVGGGCSGHQYGMAVAESADDTDTVVEQEGVKMVVDRDSVPFIQGAEIDYVEDLMKSGFTIYNPNAVSSCACGSSFQTTGNEGTPRSCV
jgi:iron-sulfur cluster assembly protein